MTCIPGNLDPTVTDSLAEGLRKSLSFQSVMNSAFTRKFFYSYLEEENQQDLLGFWAGVEELRKAEKTLWHQLATELFYSYINKPNGCIQVLTSL